MASTDARPVPKKNVAYRHSFALRKSDGTLITTWAGQDSEVSKDGGNYADCSAEATEIQTSGTGYIDLTSDEMNADCVMLKVTVTNTGALPYVVVLFPEEGGDIRVDATQVSGSATAADNCELMFNGTGYAGGTTKLGVNVLALNGALTDGSPDATNRPILYLKKLSLENPDASDIALHASASGSDSVAVYIEGSGYRGYGLFVQAAGTRGNGIWVTGEESGVYIEGTGNAAPGIKVAGDESALSLLSSGIGASCINMTAPSSGTAIITTIGSTQSPLKVGGRWTIG